MNVARFEKLVFLCCLSGVPAPAIGADGESRNPPGPTVSLVKATSSRTSKGVVNVDVFVSHIRDLRTYQLQVEVTGGKRGALSLQRITVDKSRSDFVFGSDFVIDAVDEVQDRVGGLRFSGGKDVGEMGYLATFQFRATDNALGTFHVNLRIGEDTFLLDSHGDLIAFQKGSSLDLSVDRTGAIRDARDARRPR